MIDYQQNGIKFDNKFLKRFIVIVVETLILDIETIWCHQPQLLDTVWEESVKAALITALHVFSPMKMIKVNAYPET